MSKSEIKLFVENTPEERIAQAIFRAEIKEGLIAVVPGFTASGALALAQSSLRRQPDLPVALLINTRTEDSIAIEEMRGSAERILARTAPLNWCVALAIPKLDAWAMTDPRIRTAVEENEAARRDYIARAILIKELTKDVPFDRVLLRREYPDFQRLEAFIREHSAAKVETR